MKKLFVCAFFGATIALPASAQQNAYVAMAVADGPVHSQPIHLAFHGTDARRVVLDAYMTCFQQASEGYRHTCKVSFTTGWIAATMCLRDASKDSSIVFDIKDDQNSAEAAAEKTLKYLTQSEHADATTCKLIAEDNANDLQSARSVGKGERAP